MIDTHCHIDLYPNPQKLLRECEVAGITVLAMTNLPSHFEMGYQHVLPFKRVRLALGMHPLCADQHDKEFPIFLRNLSKTSYVGEIGLDFSREGYHTKNLQLRTFEKVLDAVAKEKKLLSLHSRRAEKDVLDFLVDKGIKSAIFHWYSGPINLIEKISRAGYYFSVNPSMTKSESGRKIIENIPLKLMLTETDGPFTALKGRPTVPADVSVVYKHLSSIWGMTEYEVRKIISTNFRTALSIIS